LGGLAKDAELKIVLSFHLKGETPNGYNGDSCTFLIDFYLNQPGAPPPPSNRILLENKDANWKPIIGDGTWGIAEYSASDLKLTVWAYGLTGSTAYQVKLTSPEVASWYPVDAKTRVAMASALASDKYDGTSPGTAPPGGFNLFERGYWPSATPNLGTTYAAGDVGVWAFTKHGSTASGVKTDANGYFKFEKTASLPKGDYSYIKLVVSLDDSPWTPALMECWIPMFFTIP